ncbi:KilA-N domain-containing protein [Neisseria gonorrhoeae]|uniref:KilA-N domain-containing protein n=4 Tax=Neisseria gonorrhoeae TaxID=485 RepID=UPI000ACB3148|nr:KilA-N domain-containing protein [Neisseria gonorrhoeae]AZG69460.1 KilA-N domain-containing protein [Neisseria gonorrhoeae]MBT8029579.1 KilA-N domain-containing protein [Neisseria gonorrhoeae]
MNVSVLNFGNTPVSFRQDGFLNATSIAAHFGKLPKDYLKTEQTQQYISALAESLSERTKILTDENQLVIVKKGNSKNFTQGTWLHPKLAIHFARWLNPRFAVWCDEQIEILLNGNVSDGIKPAKTTADDRTGLRRAVAALVGRKGIDYSSAYSMIHQRFNVESVEDLPAGKLSEAVAYVHALTLHTGLTGEVLDAPPKAEPKLPIDGNSLADIAAMVYYGTRMIESGKDISAPLKQLGNRQAVTMWTVWHETRPILKRSAAALEVLRGYADKDASGRIAACLEGIYSKAAVR